RSRHARAGEGRRRGPALSPRSGERRLRVRRADRGHRARGRPGRDRGARAGAGRAAARVRHAARGRARVVTSEPVETLVARIDAAVRSRARLRDRTLDATIAALVAAAGRWSDDAELVHAVAEAARLSTPVAAAGLRFAAAAIEAGALRTLVEAEWGPGAARRPAPDGPTLVAHVLASNVPALALPAIA